MKNRLFILFVCMAAIVACQPQSNRSVVSSESVEGGSGATGGGNSDIFGKWSTANLPISVKFSQDFSSSEITKLKTVTNQWEGSAGINLVDFSSSTVANKDFSSANSYLDGSIEVHQVNTDALPEGALAVTIYNGFQVNPGTSNEYIQIFDADILFNYYDFSFSTSLVAGTYDLESVMIHEAGHLFGMGHTPSSASSVMVPNIQEENAKRNLFSRDANNIFNNYDITSGSSSLSFASTGRSDSTKKKIGEPVTGMIELSADKTCRHYRNGKLIEKHQIK